MRSGSFQIDKSVILVCEARGCADTKGFVVTVSAVDVVGVAGEFPDNDELIAASRTPCKLVMRPCKVGFRVS